MRPRESRKIIKHCLLINRSCKNGILPKICAYMAIHYFHGVCAHLSPHYALSASIYRGPCQSSVVLFDSSVEDDAPLRFLVTLKLWMVLRRVDLTLSFGGTFLFRPASSALRCVGRGGTKGGGFRKLASGRSTNPGVVATAAWRPEAANMRCPKIAKTTVAARSRISRLASNHCSQLRPFASPRPPDCRPHSPCGPSSDGKKASAKGGVWFSPARKKGSRVGLASWRTAVRTTLSGGSSFTAIKAEERDN